MERDIESCIECYEGPESGSPDEKSKGLNIIDDFNEMYNEQLKKAQDASDGTLQLQIKTLQHWVFDLSQQNKMLVKTVEELEEEALKRIDSPYPGTKESRRSFPQFAKMSAPRAVPVKKNKVEDKRKVNGLRNDLLNLLELLRRLRLQGVWNLDGLKFKEVSYEDIFGQPPPPHLCTELFNCPIKDFLSDQTRWKFNFTVTPATPGGTSTEQSYSPCTCSRSYV